MGARILPTERVTPAGPLGDDDLGEGPLLQLRLPEAETQALCQLSYSRWQAAILAEAQASRPPSVRYDVRRSPVRDGPPSAPPADSAILDPSILEKTREKGGDEMDAWHSTLGPDLRLMALISAVEDIRHANAPAPRSPRSHRIIRWVRRIARAAWTVPMGPAATPALRDYPFARS